MRFIRIVPLAVVTVVALGVLVLAQEAHDDAGRAQQYLDEIMSAPYTDWAFEPNVPEGYYVGVEPHGMILRTFINDVALQNFQGGQTVFSEGAMIVKENHMPGEVDLAGMQLQSPVEGFEGNLSAINYMVKVAGYNAEAGDRFWAKMGPDGRLDAAGKPEGCISCHRQVENQDYVFNFAPGGT